MQPRKPSVRLEVEWTSEAWTEIRTLSASERRPVMEAAAKLAAGHHRKSTAAMVEARIPGDHRLLYRLVAPLPGRASAGARPRVQILCAMVTGATGAAVARPGAAELRRRAAILRTIGGGIPHEVVRRAWLVERRAAVMAPDRRRASGRGARPAGCRSASRRG